MAKYFIVNCSMDFHPAWFFNHMLFFIFHFFNSNAAIATILILNSGVWCTSTCMAKTLNSKLAMTQRRI